MYHSPRLGTVPISSYDKNWIRMFDVSDPQRHKKGFTVYKITSKVFPKTDPGGVTILTVWKRYNDFKKLHAELERIHHQLYLSVKFPEFPKANSFHRFEYEVIEERKRAAASLLQFAGNHIQLFTSAVFNGFFEEGYNPKDFTHHTIAEQYVEADAKCDVRLPECLVPEIVWRTSEKNGEDNTSQVLSIASEEDGTSTSPDSFLNGSIFNSLSGSGSSILSPLTARHDSNSVRKSQSQILTPIYLAEQHFSDFECENSDQVCSEAALLPNVDEMSPKSLTNLIADPKTPQGRPGILSVFPRFPNRTKETKVSEEKLLSQSLTDSYICEAAGNFAVAQECESSGHFEGAFSSYKEGIRILLAGAKDDADSKRQILVKAKLEKYLSLAENMHGRITSLKLNFLQSPVQSSRATSYNPNSASFCPSPIELLNDYKMVGTIPGGFYLVMKKTLSQATEPRCYVVKVIPFSMEPSLGSAKELVIPRSIRYMVKLFQWFELDTAYILLLQYAGGGKLVDFIKSYHFKTQSEIHDETERALPVILKEVQDKSVALCTMEQRENENNTSTATAKNDVRKSTGKENLTAQFTNYDRVDQPKFEQLRLSEFEPQDVLTTKELQSLSSGRRSSIDDLIASSKGLLEAVTTTLSKVKSNCNLAGEFLSKSLEEIDVSAGSTQSASRLETQKKLTEAATVFLPTLPLTYETIGAEADEDLQRPVGTIPEACIKGWAAEIVVCLQLLHALGLVYGNLAMHNILLGENGHVLLSFKAQWPNVDQSLSPATINEYCAPEVVQSGGQSSCKVHPSCDFWSLGAILFEFFTGQNVQDVHPEGFHPQTVICIPTNNAAGEKISSDVRSLLTELLEVNPSLRLGYYGAEEIKPHPCFDGFDWDQIAAELEETNCIPKFEFL